MIRWGSVVVGLVLAGCLEEPPLGRYQYPTATALAAANGDGAMTNPDAVLADADTNDGATTDSTAPETDIEPGADGTDGDASAAQDSVIPACLASLKPAAIDALAAPDLLCPSGKAALTEHFDLGDDFSSESNPNGAWSLGLKSKLTATDFTLLDQKVSLQVHKVPLNVWQLSPNGWHGGVQHNPTKQWLHSDSQCDSGIWLAPGGVQIQPSFYGDYDVVRWTAPSTAQCAFAVLFRGNDLAPTTSDVHVLVGGKPVYDSDVMEFGVDHVWTAPISVKVGTTVDALVGFGKNFDYTSDNTGILFRVYCSRCL